MNTLNNITEMNLTQREINIIAFEAEGVNPYDANMMNEFSVNTFHRIMKASTTILSPSYVVRRCYFLVNGKKLAN